MAKDIREKGESSLDVKYGVSTWYDEGFKSNALAVFADFDDMIGGK